MRINRYTVKLVKEGSINYSLEESVISPEVTRDIIEKVFEQTLLNNAGQLIGIKAIDHIVIGDIGQPQSFIN